MRKDQYIIKNSYRAPVDLKKITKSKSTIPLEDETCGFDEEGYPIPEGVSLLSPVVCKAILSNYSKLKEDCWGAFDGDTWYLMTDFDNISEKALEKYPIYRRIVELKIDEYISSLWRNKIPKLIASAAEDEYLNWYYTEIEKGQWKKCSRCGQIKLAHNKYFSKNKTSKDGLYSICKACRNAKTKNKGGLINGNC